MTNDVRIVAVEDSKGLLKFVEYPFQLYRDDPLWVPPFIEERLDFFNPKKNPFFEHSRSQLYLGYRGDRLVGTIGAVINDNHNKCHDELSGAFGFFETIDDQAVADALLVAAEDWVRGQGMNLIRGPLNFSLNDEIGLLIDGFETAPMLMMTHNPRYYAGLVEAHGYVKAMDVYAYICDFEEALGKAPPKVFRVAEKAAQMADVHVRKVDLRHFDKEVALIKQVYNSAWEKNWGFVPMTDPEIDHLAAALRQLVDKDLVFIAETAEGRPVGVSVTLPDANQALLRSGGGHMWPFGVPKYLWHRRDIDQVRLLIMGVIQEYRSRGLDAVFYVETARVAMSRGFKRMESSWILETNTMMNRIIENLGGKRYKTYRVYERPL
jgi:GNAT superfamily N-acetyltransferase